MHCAALGGRVAEFGSCVPPHSQKVWGLMGTTNSGTCWARSLSVRSVWLHLPSCAPLPRVSGLSPARLQAVPTCSGPSGWPGV